MPGTFAREIDEQPRVASVLAADPGPAEAAATAIRRRDPVAAVLVGRGTSYHAALYARYLLEVRNHLPVATAAPSVYTLYGGRPDLRRFVVVGVSQSGESSDVDEVLVVARRSGALTIGITNHPNSRLAAASDVVLPCLAGPEVSVPASKTYLASLVRLAQLSQALEPEPAFRTGLAELPDLLASALEQAHRDTAVVGIHSAPPIFLGRGYQLGTALEMALKVTETSGLAAQAFSEADFLHGPIAQVGADRPVLLLEPYDRTRAIMEQLATRLRSRGARLIHVVEGPDPSGRGRGEPVLGVPRSPHEALAPILFAPTAQLLALHVARALGKDPDHPAGLTKLTETR